MKEGVYVLVSDNRKVRDPDVSPIVGVERHVTEEGESVYLKNLVGSYGFAVPLESDDPAFVDDEETGVLRLPMPDGGAIILQWPNAELLENLDPYFAGNVESWPPTGTDQEIQKRLAAMVYMEMG